MVVVTVHLALTLTVGYDDLKSEFETLYRHTGIWVEVVEIFVFFGGEEEEGVSCLSNLVAQYSSFFLAHYLFPCEILFRAFSIYCVHYGCVVTYSFSNYATMYAVL